MPILSGPVWAVTAITLFMVVAFLGRQARTPHQAIGVIALGGVSIVGLLLVFPVMFWSS